MKPAFEKAHPEVKDIERRDIKHEAIAELREPIQKILEQLRERSDQEGYSLIIGDDASGRIPTRMFEYVLGALYEKRGFPHPEVRFFAGSHGLRGLEEPQGGLTRKALTFLVPGLKSDAEIKTDNVEQYLKKIRARHKRVSTGVLVVTDTIETGRALKPLSNALKKQHINFDIATMGMVGDREESVAKYLGSEIFYGMRGTPAIYTERSLGGVRKDRRDLFAEVLRGEGVSEIVREAREDAKTLAQELVAWYGKEAARGVSENNDKGQVR